MVIGNTLKISLINLIAGFPIPIVLALLLNTVRNQKFKKVVQTTIYAPHFISAVVIVGMINLFLSPTSGIINKFITMFGGTPQMFMGSAVAFPAIFVISENSVYRFTKYYAYHHHIADYECRADSYDWL